MPDSRRHFGDAATPAVVTAAARPVTPATVAADNTTKDLFSYKSWQDEAWAFLFSLGEFNNAVTWRANALSRVRLTAAEVVPGGDEPEVITEGPAADLVARIGGGAPGAAKLMQSWGVQLDVPGGCWTIAEEVNGVDRWMVRSTDEVRLSDQPYRDPATKVPVLFERTNPRTGQVEVKPVRPFEVREGERTWRQIHPDSVVFELYEPNHRFAWQPDSAARPSLSIMRRIDLYDRAITAILLSRIGMNGFLKIAREISFDARPEYKDHPDPFVAELVEFASRNIKNPGSAGAALPFPVRIPMQYMDGFQHLTTSDGVPKELLDARGTEIVRLATTLRIATERLTGQSDVNHWGLWELSEEEIKFSVAPLAETVCDALTAAYLEPALLGDGGTLVGPNGGRLIVWYDTSELNVSTDRSSEATQANEDLVISDTARRREIGMDEADKPEGDELRDQILRQWVKIPELAQVAFYNLTGAEVKQPPGGGGPSPPAAGDPPAPLNGRAPTPARGERGPPDTAGLTRDQAREAGRVMAATLATTLQRLDLGRPAPAGRPQPRRRHRR